MSACQAHCEPEMDISNIIPDGADLDPDLDPMSEASDGFDVDGAAVESEGSEVYSVTAVHGTSFTKWFEGVKWADVLGLPSISLMARGGAFAGLRSRFVLFLWVANIALQERECFAFWAP